MLIISRGKAWMGPDGRRMAAEPYPLVLKPKRQQYTLTYHSNVNEIAPSLNETALWKDVPSWKKELAGDNNRSGATTTATTTTSVIPVDLNANAQDLLLVHHPKREDGLSSMGDSQCRLVFHLYDISLQDHSLQSEEGRASIQLEQLFRQWNEDVKSERSITLERKLLSLREHYLRLKSQTVEKTPSSSTGETEKDEESLLAFLMAIQETQKNFVRIAFKFYNVNYLDRNRPHKKNDNWNGIF